MLHYEMVSKSACYLCDLLVLKQDRYLISHAYGHLYDRWIFPDISWMSARHKDLTLNIISSKRKGDKVPAEC